jgi:hypothetical protein
MGAAIFQFQSMITIVVNSISGTMLPSIQNVAYVLLTISLVLGIYEAYIKGGDVRSLAGTFLKYAVAAFAIGYWSNLFSDLFTGFNQLASSIDNSYGFWDMAKSWSQQLQLLYQNNGYQGVMNSIPWTPAGLLTLLEIIVAYMFFPIVVQIFTLIYTFWGSCLFAIGPLVVALAPSSIINSLSKYYVMNLGVWNAWVIIYAIFGTLITAINANNVNALANGSGAGVFGGGVGGPLNGGIQMIGFVSIIYAILILLIPMVAAYVLRGQFSAVGAGVAMVGSRIVGGAVQGAQAGAAGPFGAIGAGMIGAGMGLVGVNGSTLFKTPSEEKGGGGRGPYGGGGSMPPPNTPDDPHLTSSY